MMPAQETPQQAAQRLAAKALRDGYKFEDLHAYTDTQGSQLYWRIRAKHPQTGKKWIRPMKLNGQGFTFGEPTYPKGKPLYRLHELAMRLDEPVMIVEGELCADKLAHIGMLATTSGGVSSADAADWQVLAGRSVTIWPDYDGAGKQYAEAVKAMLFKLGCSVRVIDVELLGLAPKGDAVDWLNANPEATAAQVLELACVAGNKLLPQETPISLPASNHECPYGNGRFALSEEGVFFIDSDKDGREKAPVWLCSPLSVIAKTRNAKSCEWGRLLAWQDDDQVRHQWAMPLALLQGDDSDVRRELVRLGLAISPAKAVRNLLVAYLQVWPVKAQARCVDRLGWHGRVYVTPDESIGQTDEIIVFQQAQAMEPALSASGTLDQWCDSVSALAVGNSRLVFALSVAFAGALAEIVGEDSGGFHLRGSSSSGKSTALKVAASVWGGPATYPRLWRATANGLEGLAALHNDGLLILDELSQLDPKEAGEAAYLLANGQGKTRASRIGAARQAARWRLVFLSAGEESLSALMARAGKKANVGQEIRLADIEVDAGAGMGAFEELHHHPTPAALALALQEAATHYHGAVGIEWLRCIVNDRPKLAGYLAESMRHFVEETAPKEAAGQVLRVARRFALVAVAGELATHYGLTGWPEGEAITAAQKCFAAWLDAFGGTANREERAMLSQVRAFFETHGASRFEDMNAETDQRILNRAGFYRYKGKVREYIVLSEAFKREVCQGFDAKAVDRALKKAGWLALGGDGRTTQKVRLPGIEASTRVYIFTSTMWEAEE